MVNDNAIDYRVDVGTNQSWLVPWISGSDVVAATVIEDTLGGLMADTKYFFRILYRPADESLGRAWQVYRADSTDTGLGVYSFHTARDSASEFVFTIDADSHGAGVSTYPDGVQIFDLVMRNAAEDNPDFHISMGDHINPDDNGVDSVYSSLLAANVLVRGQMDAMGVAAPFYLVLGNHEDEYGWTQPPKSDSLPCYAARARLEMWPNPQVGDFYSGDTTQTACCGPRENYYAWEWGSALFVVLDPYWYTALRPNEAGAADPWRWTLGETQYDWLYETLHGSGQPWKFVFVHQLVGGSNHVASGYGRGGIEWVRQSVAGNNTFEWGGEDSTGADVYAAMRPGWSHGDIHSMLVAEGVDIVFKGHDHAFHYQVLDSLVYQTCPTSGYCGGGNCYGAGFAHADIYPDSVTVNLNNTGHLRLTANPDSVVVDYIRAVLSEDEPLVEGADSVYNQTISHTYTLYP